MNNRTGKPIVLKLAELVNLFPTLNQLRLYE